MARVHDSLEGSVDRFEAALYRLNQGVEDMFGALRRSAGRLDNIENDLFELRHHARMPSRLGRQYMNVRPVHIPELDVVERVYGSLPSAEWDDLVDIDAAALAHLRTAGGVATSPEVLVVLELSLTVNADDVRRIHRRAEILRRLGLPVEAAVDGEFIRPDARELAEQLGVVTLVVKEPQAA